MHGSRTRPYFCHPCTRLVCMPKLSFRMTVTWLNVQFGSLKMTENKPPTWPYMQSSAANAEVLMLLSCLVLTSTWQTSSWSITPVAGGGALRHATCWFLKAAGLSCSTTTAGSWFQSPTVLAANELRSPDEDAPIALNLNLWFALVFLSAATKPIWSAPTTTCPVTTLYNKASLRSRRRSLRSHQPRSCSIYWMSSYDPLWQTSLIATVSFPISHNPWPNEGPKLELHILMWSVLSLMYAD